MVIAMPRAINMRHWQLEADAELAEANAPTSAALVASVTCPCRRTALAFTRAAWATLHRQCPSELDAPGGRRHTRASEPRAEDMAVKVGIGLPSTIVGVAGELLIEWARRADACRFSSLGLIDRVAYPNYEVMATLGAA